MSRVDMSFVGKRFGKLTVIDFDHINEHRNTCWLCRCDCGNELVVSRNNLTTGNTSSCGCLGRGPKREDIIGKRFGRLTVVAFDHSDMHRNSYWLCECDCGNTTVATRGGLISGNTTSCGCYQIEGIRDRATTHGLSGSSLYRRWQSMRNRCNDKNNAAYHRYGGRGIKVCDEWNDFENFRDWALSNGYQEDLTLDRIDNEADYSPKNCRWATWRVQGNNRSTNRIITYGGESHNITEWCELLNLNFNTLWARINRGDMHDFEGYFRD